MKKKCKFNSFYKLLSILLVCLIGMSSFGAFAQITYIFGTPEKEKIAEIVVVPEEGDQCPPIAEQAEGCFIKLNDETQCDEWVYCTEQEYCDSKSETCLNCPKPEGACIFSVGNDAKGCPIYQEQICDEGTELNEENCTCSCMEGTDWDSVAGLCCYMNDDTCGDIVPATAGFCPQSTGCELGEYCSNNVCIPGCKGKEVATWSSNLSRYYCCLRGSSIVRKPGTTSTEYVCCPKSEYSVVGSGTNTFCCPLGSTAISGKSSNKNTCCTTDEVALIGTTVSTGYSSYIGCCSKESVAYAYSQNKCCTVDEYVKGSGNTGVSCCPEDGPGYGYVPGSSARRCCTVDEILFEDDKSVTGSNSSAACCPSESAGYSKKSKECCTADEKLIFASYGSDAYCCPKDSPGYGEVQDRCCNVGEKLVKSSASLGYYCCPEDYTEKSASFYLPDPETGIMTCSNCVRGGTDPNTKKRRCCTEDELLFDGVTIKTAGDIYSWGCCPQGSVGYSDVQEKCCMEGENITGSGVKVACCPGPGYGYDGTSTSRRCCEANEIFLSGPVAKTGYDANAGCCPIGSTAYSYMDKRCCNADEAIMRDANRSYTSHLGYCCSKESSGTGYAPATSSVRCCTSDEKSVIDVSNTLFVSDTYYCCPASSTGYSSLSGRCCTANERPIANRGCLAGEHVEDEEVLP